MTRNMIHVSYFRSWGFVKKYITIWISLVLLFFCVACNTSEQSKFQIGSAVAEFEDRIYFSDQQSRSVCCYDTSHKTNEIILESIIVDSLVLDWPRLWMIEDGCRLLKYDIVMNDIETVYESQSGLDGLLFLYEDDIYFEEFSDEQNVDCIQLKSGNSDHVVFIENSNIFHSYSMGFFQDHLYYSSLRGPAYRIAMEYDAKPQLIDTEHWFTIVGTDNTIYYSKYIDNKMKTLSLNQQESIPDNNFDFIQVLGNNDCSVFLEVHAEGEKKLLQYDEKNIKTVFNHRDQFLYSDNQSAFYYVDHGVLFWSNKNIIDQSCSKKYDYYIFIYDTTEEVFFLIDAFSNGSK